MLKVVSKQYGLPDSWNFRPPAGIRLVDNPTDFYLQFLDEFNTRNPDAFARLFAQGESLTKEDVTAVFNSLVTSPEARDKLQHYHSRIAHYYENSTEIA